jgi:uncharacterized protein
MIVTSLINAVFQLILITGIVYTCWFFTGRKRQPFSVWIGWKKPRLERKTTFLLFFLAALLLLIAPGLVVVRFLLDPAELASAQFYGLGVSGLVPALIYSFVQTGLSEEILFRGFIGKRLCARWGYRKGNSAQALLFGLLHGAMIYPSAGFYTAIGIVLLTGAAGFSMGAMNERLAGGSILPSWLMHGISNTVSTLFMLFQWL